MLLNCHIGIWQHQSRPQITNLERSTVLMTSLPFMLHKLLLAWPTTKARILCLEYSSLRDFGP
jgi:hypothetical protein